MDTEKYNFDKKMFVKVAVITAVLFVISHGYRMVNLLFSHDSLMINQLDADWQISIGRFIQPLIPLMRGTLCSPFVILFVAYVFLTLSCYLIIDLFGIRKNSYVFMVIGIMIINTVLGASYATYIPWADGYAVSLFCSVFAIYLVHYFGKKGIIPGMILVLISMGIYQAYISAALSCVLILFMLDMLNNRKLKDAMRKVLISAVTVMCGAGLYLIGYYFSCKILSIPVAESENSVGSINGFNLAEALKNTYYVFFKWLWEPKSFISQLNFIPQTDKIAMVLIRIINVSVFLLMIYMIIKLVKIRKISAINVVFTFAGMIAFPIAANFICIISNGFIHGLMKYAFCLFYVFAVILCQQIDKEDTKKRKLNVLLTVCMACVIWNSYILVNQIYMIKGVEENATLSYMTRIVNEVESTEGYVEGVTPVAFVGTVEGTTALIRTLDWNKINVTGLTQSMITYEGTDYQYLDYVLQCHINLVRVPEITDEIMEMPTFPSEGSVRFIGDTIVVKVSN